MRYIPTTHNETGDENRKPSSGIPTENIKKGGDGNPYPSFFQKKRLVKVSRPWRTSCRVKAPAPSSEMVRASFVKITLS